MILTQEDQPGTHSTPTEIAIKLNIDRWSVFRIIDQGLELRPPRKLGRCQNLLIRTLKSAWFVQKSSCQSMLRKHHKLHSLVKKWYLRRVSSITHMTMWFMLRRKWGKKRCQKKDYSTKLKNFPSKYWFLWRYRKLVKLRFFCWKEYKVNSKYYRNVLIEENDSWNEQAGKT